MVLTHLRRVGFSTTTLWTCLFPTAGCLVTFYCYCFIEIPVANANSVDPDQMPHSVASDLGLHCLPITLLRISRLNWVNRDTISCPHGAVITNQFCQLQNESYPIACFIGPDKMNIYVYFFLISPQNLILWVFIRSTSLKIYFCGEIRKILVLLGCHVMLTSLPCHMIHHNHVT